MTLDLNLRPKLSILLPVRNEGMNIALMVKILDAAIEIPFESLIIYDFLEDTSVEATRKIQPNFPDVKLVHNNLGKGVINAIRAGVESAKGEYILIAAVDEIGPVLAIKEMIHLMDEGCEFVSCTRYAHGGRRLGGSYIGGILSRLANRFFCALSGSTLSDATTGIKMFKKDLFDKITLESRPIGWAVVFEMAIKAQMLGLKMGEVPIVSIDRLYGGKSTFKLSPWVGEYLRWFFWGMRNLPHSSRGEKPVVHIPSTTL